MTANKLPLYWDWVREEARVIKSDGCSKVPDFYLQACLQHDLAYWYAKNPRSAYKHFVESVPDYWIKAAPIFQSEADAQFRQTIQKKSKLKKFSPMSWWRWAGLKLFGKKAWNSHSETQKDSVDAGTT